MHFKYLLVCCKIINIFSYIKHDSLPFAVSDVRPASSTLAPLELWQERGRR